MESRVTDQGLYHHGILLGILVVILAVLAVPGAAAAPFSFTISPQSAQAAPGGSVPYTITINGNPGFNSPVTFVMKVSAAGYTDTVNLGTYNGPYPKTFTYTLPVPSQVPAGVAVKATVTGTSGADQYSQAVDLQVTGGGGPVESVISAITSAINSILQSLGLR